MVGCPSLHSPSPLPKIMHEKMDSGMMKTSLESSMAKLNLSEEEGEGEGEGDDEEKRFTVTDLILVFDQLKSLEVNAAIHSANSLEFQYKTHRYHVAFWITSLVFLAFWPSLDSNTLYLHPPASL